MLDEDVKWFISTCHPCETWQTHHLHLPLMIPDIPTLFHKFQCSCQPSMSFAISFRPIVLCLLGLSGTLFRKKMRRLLETLYLRIFSANGVEWLKLLLTTALHL